MDTTIGEVYLHEDKVSEYKGGKSYWVSEDPYTDIKFKEDEVEII